MKTRLILFTSAAYQIVSLAQAFSTVKIDCKPISPFLIGSDNCQTQVNAVDVDYSHDYIAMGGSSGDGDLVNLQSASCDVNEMMPFTQLRKRGEVQWSKQLSLQTNKFQFKEVVGLQFDPNNETSAGPSYVISIINNRSVTGRSVIVIQNFNDGSVNKARFLGEGTGTGSPSSNLSISKSSNVLYIATNIQADLSLHNRSMVQIFNYFTMDISTNTMDSDWNTLQSSLTNTLGGIQQLDPNDPSKLYFAYSHQESSGFTPVQKFFGYHTRNKFSGVESITQKTVKLSNQESSNKFMKTSAVTDGNHFASSYFDWNSQEPTTDQNIFIDVLLENGCALTVKSKSFQSTA